MPFSRSLGAGMKALLGCSEEVLVRRAYKAFQNLESIEGPSMKILTGFLRVFEVLL